MAAAGIGNPAGAVWIGDYGAPSVVVGKARNEIISGGVLVFASGAQGVVSSGTNSFVSEDIQFTRDASGTMFNGICLQTTAVSGAIAVATKGVFILTANGTVTAGATQQCDGNNAVADVTAVSGANVTALVQSTIGLPIGRALTSAASGGYAVVEIRGA